MKHICETIMLMKHSNLRKEILERKTVAPLNEINIITISHIQRTTNKEQ